MTTTFKNLYIGTSGWSYKDWVGVFYPEGTKAADYLSHYSRRFRTVEIDSTFYGIPRVSTVQKWAETTDDDFIFAPKVPQNITHEKRLRDCEEEWNHFITIMNHLGSRLGPVVLQFDYQFSYDAGFSVLEEFLRVHSGDVRLCVEIRNKDWHREAFYEMLRTYNVALVLNDLYYMPRVVQITADFTYIRLLGNRKQIPDDFSHSRVNRDKDLDWWSKWIEEFIEKELDVYVYSNNRYQGHAPATVRQMINRLGG